MKCETVATSKISIKVKLSMEHLEIQTAIPQTACGRQLPLRKGALRGADKRTGGTAMTELEMQIIEAMREASDENLTKALEFLCRIELEETLAAGLSEGGEVA